MNMYNHNKILRMLTRCITIAITFLFISCESWYSYCFDINNNTNDSIKIITTPMISNYNIQIHNVYFQDIGVQGFSSFKDHPTDTIFTIPPKASLSAIVGWYSRHSPEFVPEADGVIPLWLIIKNMYINNTIIEQNIWDDKTKWKKDISDDNTEIRFQLNLGFKVD